MWSGTKENKISSGPGRHVAPLSGRGCLLRLEEASLLVTKVPGALGGPHPGGPSPALIGTAPPRPAPTPAARASPGSVCRRAAGDGRPGRARKAGLGPPPRPRREGWGVHPSTPAPVPLLLLAQESD